MPSRRGLIAGAAGLAPTAVAQTGAPHPVLAWTHLLDSLLEWVPARRGRAAMHLAMHDALNACLPLHARFWPPAPDEPAPGRAAEAPGLAMAGAAATVLAYLHPHGAAGAAPLLVAARRGVPASVFKPAQQLGAAVARVMIGWLQENPASVLLIDGTNRRGRWRPTPPAMAPTQLVIFPAFFVPFRPAWLDPGPPTPGSAAFQQDLDEVRDWGDAASIRRGAGQTEAAQYWVGRDLGASAARMATMAIEARPAGLHADARAMALLCAGMADSYLAWVEGKRHYDFWRPVTAIRDAGATPAQQAWLPLLPTPAHPDFPSGHATDISMAELLLAGLFGPRGAVRFPGLGVDGPWERDFPATAAAAEECRQSRLWAGAHYRFANDAGQRLAVALSPVILSQLPPLPAQPG